MPSFFKVKAPQVHAVQEARGGGHAAPGSHISEGSKDEYENGDEDEDESTDNEEGAAALKLTSTCRNTGMAARRKRAALPHAARGGGQR